jgi:hypothetical protein
VRRGPRGSPQRQATRRASSPGAIARCTDSWRPCRRTPRAQPRTARHPRDHPKRNLRCPAARATVSAFPPSRSGKPMTPGRSSDSRARPAARLLAAREVASATHHSAMARIQPACPLRERSRGSDTRKNRPNTAAGPSRNRTGVPCLPTAEELPHRATRVEGQSIGAAQRMSIERDDPTRPARFSSRRSDAGKLCRLR